MNIPKMYVPHGISYRQLVILVTHTGVDNLPVPIKDPQSKAAIESLVDKGFLMRCRSRHTRLTSAGRKAIWDVMETYLQLFRLLHIANGADEMITMHNLILAAIDGPQESKYKPNRVKRKRVDPLVAALLASGQSRTLADSQDQALPSERSAA